MGEGQDRFIFYVKMFITHQQPQSKLWKRKTHPWWLDNYCFIKPKILNQNWHCHARVLKVLPITTLYNNGSLHPTLLVFMLLVLLFSISSLVLGDGGIFLLLSKFYINFPILKPKNWHVYIYTWCTQMGTIASMF